MKWLKWVIRAVAALAVVTLTVALSFQGAHLRTLKRVNREQAVVIDSLLRDRTKVEIQLFVTDRSVNKIYGRYNKGTIQMPSAKTYVLECDSTSVLKK